MLACPTKAEALYKQAFVGYTPLPGLFFFVFFTVLVASSFLLPNARTSFRMLQLMRIIRRAGKTHAMIGSRADSCSADSINERCLLVVLEIAE